MHVRWNDLESWQLLNSDRLFYVNMSSSVNVMNQNGVWIIKPRSVSYGKKEMRCRAKTRANKFYHGLISDPIVTPVMQSRRACAQHSANPWRLLLSDTKFSTSDTGGCLRACWMWLAHTNVFGDLDLRLFLQCLQLKMPQGRDVISLVRTTKSRDLKPMMMYIFPKFKQLLNRSIPRSL